MFFSEKDQLQAVRKEVRKLSAEAGRFSGTLGTAGRSMQKMTREFASGMEQMQLQVRKMREEMNRLGQEMPSRMERFGTFLDKLGAVSQQVASISSQLSKLALGTTWSATVDEGKAAARVRALYAAKGKTNEEMRRFDELTSRLATVNPYLNKSQVLALVSKSEQVNPKHAEAYAEQATKLSLTTKYGPEDHLKMMAALRQSTGIDDAARLANSIQYMSNHAGDLNGKFVDAVVEFSAQNGKLLDTPEKMATMVSEIGKLGIWNDDKAFSALRESTLKFADQGELTKLLQTQYESQGKGAKSASLAKEEAAKITGALASGDQDEQRIALGKLMMSIATMQDKAAQQKVLQSLGGNAGKDLGAQFPHLLETAGKIATGETRTQVGNEVDKSYEAATRENAYHDQMVEQAKAKQEVMEASAFFAKDTSGFYEGISQAMASLIRTFNEANVSVKSFIDDLIIAGTIVIGMAKAAQMVPLGRDLWDASRKLFQGKRQGPAGGTVPDHDSGGAKSDGGKSGGPHQTAADLSDSNAKDSKSATAKEMAKDQNGAGKSAAAHTESKGSAHAVDGFASRQFSGFSPGGSHSGIPGGAGLKGAKTLLRKVPLLGTVLGAAEWLQSDNKLEKAGQLGAEALGSWGGAAAGAAAGAAIGSVVPIIGTAAGGVIGGLIGGFGGSMLGSAAFDGIKSWWQGGSEAPVTGVRKPLEAEERQAIRQTMPSGPPVPGSSPASAVRAQPSSVSITIPQITIPLHAEGVLHDIPTMLKMLGDPSVAQKIKSIIEKSLLDALETRGGVPV